MAMRLLLICGWCLMTSLTFEATWYGKEFDGNYTYSGERFDMNAMTCASNVFKMGLKLKITNLENKKSVVVKVTDKGRMPNHVIDLSQGAFSKIANLKKGRIKIRIKPILK